MALQTRTIPRQVLYLMMASAGLLATVILLTHWGL
jgi:hypothetical protein